MTKLTHVDSKGEAQMVDISQKADTEREAVARGRVMMKLATLEQIRKAGLEKGDVLSVARVAGIMAAKKTPDLIPLCHPLLIGNIVIDFDLARDDSIGITAKAKSTGKTGVEMEALVAVSVTALTIYDMCKALDGSKKGGKSGTYRKKEKK